MSGAKSSRGRKTYGTDSPYPVSLRDSGADYEDGHGPPEANPAKPFELDDLFDSFPRDPDDRPTRWSADTVRGDGHDRPKPLSVLASLFSDRMDFLRAALDELKRAEQDRHAMTREALEDIDSMIEYCERTLRLYRQQPLNDFERRRHLERQLADLKRQRRQEQVMSWRDLLSLRSEIRRLQREVASIAAALPQPRKEPPGDDE